MKPIGALLLVLLGACAHLGIRPQATTERLALWDQGHRALQANEFALADSFFTVLSRDYAGTDEGRESLFYLGVLQLDPRNPNWDPRPAEARLEHYLKADSTMKVVAHRRPEAEILLEIAHQLNLPPAERILGLQAPTTTEIVRVPQRIVTATESEAQAREIADLRQQIVAKDAQIKKLEDELERIRKTLTNGRRP